MRSTRSRRTLVALTIALACTGCTTIALPPAASPAPTASVSPTPSASVTPTPSGGATATTPPASPSVSTTPVPGGVLRLVAGRDDSAWDVTSASAATQNLLHGLTRQLVSYQPGPQFSDVAGRVVADAAADVPLPVDGRSYTFTIRSGVSWNLATPRPVTSTDFARGLKRLCSPVGGSYTATYFADTVAGFADFCTGLAHLGAGATAARISSYIETHPVTGLQTPDARTLVVTLTAPAGDFLQMMAVPEASAVPLEESAYLPGSAALRAHFVSDGPYTIVSDRPGHSLTLGRNPAWVATSDPIRKAYVDGVQVTFGADESSGELAVVGGTADFTNGLPLADPPPPVTPTTTTTASPTPTGPQLAVVTDGSSTHLVLNTRSPSAGGALGSVAVRKALNLATDKQRIATLAGGAGIAEPLTTILTPQLLGYRPTDAYPSQGNAGDPAAAKQLLTTAGYAKGMTLRLSYAAGKQGDAIAAAIRDSWAPAGITLALRPVPAGDLDKLLQTPSRRSAWDVALAPAWRPDWYGPGARTFFTALLRSGAPRNAGAFSDPAVDQLITQALAEPDGNRAADIWAQADAAVMQDAPWVPLFTARETYLRAARVRGWVWDGLGLPDYTNVWLAAA